MKEIKFRGKTKDGIWHYGWLWQSPDKKYWIKEAIERTHSADYEVIPETIGQYTGLKDKDGKEIYEGDIISVVDIGTNPFENSRHQVVYCGEDDYPAFDLKPHIDCDSNGLSYLKAGADEEMIVIGNIYENPELIRGER